MQGNVFKVSPVSVNFSDNGHSSLSIQISVWGKFGRRLLGTKLSKYLRKRRANYRTFWGLFENSIVAYRLKKVSTKFLNRGSFLSKTREIFTSCRTRLFRETAHYIVKSIVVGQLAYLSGESVRETLWGRSVVVRGFYILRRGFVAVTPRVSKQNTSARFLVGLKYQFLPVPIPLVIPNAIMV